MTLSTPDLDLLAAIVAGDTYKAAGYRLGRSEAAVKHRLVALRVKYGCASTIALVWLFRHDIDAHRVPVSLWTAA